MHVGTPPKIGMEIEANWPQISELPSDLRSVFETLSKEFPNPNRYTAYQLFCSFITQAKPHRFFDYSNGNSWVKLNENFVKRFYELAPEKYHYPDGWDWGHDSGIEMRFNGPANTLTDAENLIRGAAKWLDSFGFTKFSYAGTHVHLGHVAWIQEVFPSSLQEKAERLMWGYFMSREKGIFSIAAPHRSACESCRPSFASSEIYIPSQTFRDTTPAWALHLSIANLVGYNLHSIAYTFNNGCVQNRRKSLPTLEFRHFSGTKCETALLGYVRLLHRMFLNATNAVTERACIATREDQLDTQVVVQPYHYGAKEMMQEVSDDPWLVEWIKRTVKNNGNPINDTITTEEVLPQRLAAVG